MADEFEHGHHHMHPDPGHHHPEPYQHDGMHPGEHPWDYPHFAGFARHCAEHCDDQLPLFSQVGRGLQGDGYFVRLVQDDDMETYLEGMTYDPHTGAYTHDWFSHNVNGGKLSYRYNFYPNTDPQTFTITFKLNRPDYVDTEDVPSQQPDKQKGWEWTTPKIPYIWDTPADEPMLGIATLFIKKKGAPQWTNIHPTDADTPNSIAEANAEYEKLVYPLNHVRSEYRAPKPGDPWTVNLEYGIGGDIDVPSKDDLAKILGVTPAFIDELAGRPVPTNVNFGHKPNGDPINTKEYIDMQDDALESHLHDDLFKGKNSAQYQNEIPPSLKPLKGDNGSASVWDWIKYAIGKAEQHLHEDLYGGNDSLTYQKIANLGLAPLDGDPQGTKSVWDWIEYVMGNISDPVLRSLDLKTALGDQDVYLVLYKPTGSVSKVIPKTIADTDALAVIQADISIQYYDVLPTIAVAVTPKKVGLESPITSDEKKKLTYYGWEHPANQQDKWVDYIRLGTGEVLVICTKDGSNYKPVNLAGISLPSRVVAGTVQYPKMNPENLSNVGFGWICADSDLYTEYPDATRPVFNDQNELTNNPDTAMLSVGGSSFGDWEVYTGIGNILQKGGENSIRGGWPWATKEEVDTAMSSGSTQYDTGSYGYLFNRSVGNLGTRVQIDYARTYTLTYN